MTDMKITELVLALAVMMAPLPAFAADAKSGSPAVRAANGWVRAPVAGQKVAAAYLDLTSTRNAVLVGAGSAVAARAELHETTNEGGIMRMRPLPRLELPAGQTVKLAPSGAHIMLFELTQPVKLGDKVPLTLSIQESGAAAGTSVTTLKLELEVRPTAPGSHHH